MTIQFPSIYIFFSCFFRIRFFALFLFRLSTQIKYFMPFPLLYTVTCYYLNFSLVSCSMFFFIEILLMRNIQFIYLKILKSNNKNNCLKCVCIVYVNVYSVMLLQPIQLKRKRRKEYFIIVLTHIIHSTIEKQVSIFIQIYRRCY